MWLVGVGHGDLISYTLVLLNTPYPFLPCLLLSLLFLNFFLYSVISHTLATGGNPLHLLHFVHVIIIIFVYEIGINVLLPIII